MAPDLARTATWADVRAKARRIRSEGGVRMIVSNPGRVVAHVRGDTAVYETELNRVPGRQQVAHWACACAWASYSWGRTGPWRRYEGRLCSHALATQYEAQARGMFGRDVTIDKDEPHWIDPDSPVLQPGSYDRGTGRHSMASAGTFDGVLDGQLTPLHLDPEHGLVGPQGPVEPAAVTYPGYHPDAGLVLASAPPGATEPPTHAGLALKARDTGRVLMLQRGIHDEGDPAAGRWEFPGGGIEPGDHNTLHGAMREFAEEVGQPVPAGGVVTHTWRSGPYQGHVLVIPSEASLTLHDGRVAVNPDDPDGDHSEQAAWWEPDHAKKNPALRDECKASPWREIKMASLDGARPTLAAADPLLWHRGPDAQEFGDLPQDETADADPDHALPTTYGDDGHVASLVRAELGRRGGLSTTASARVAMRSFTPAEQRAMIDEGEGTAARNLAALDLDGTHYQHMPEQDDEWWSVG